MVSTWVKGRLTSVHFQTVESVFGSGGWDSYIEHGRFDFTSSKFTQLLQKCQLCNDITQVMTHHLKTRLSKQQGAEHYIAPSHFYMVLKKASQKNLDCS